MLVYLFAYSPGQIEVDHSLTKEITSLGNDEPRSVQELAVGRATASGLAEHLVKEVRKLGLPAQRGSGYPPPYGNTLMVKGQFLSIDQGNQTQRAVVGLAFGRADVETAVQLYQVTPGGPRKLEELRASAKSPMKPGMAETMGVGAAAGTVAAAAVVSTGATVLSEDLASGVDDLAASSARQIAKALTPFFVRQGWITSESLGY